MKATIEFNLPDDQHEFDLVVNSSAMYNALWEIKDELRNLWKYHELNEDEFNMIERIRESFHSILQDNNVNLNK
jgi:hypothetical protein